MLSVSLGPLRCRKSRCAVHKLRSLLDRMQDSTAEEKEARKREEGRFRVRFPLRCHSELTI